MAGYTSSFNGSTTKHKDSGTDWVLMAYIEASLWGVCKAVPFTEEFPNDEPVFYLWLKKAVVLEK